MDFSFDSFVNWSFDYDPIQKVHTALWLRPENMDIGGGNISIADIDVLKKHPNTDTITISGLNQDTFAYLIRTYGPQLKAIRFWKNKRIADLSLLSTMPQLEYVYFFLNQRFDRLWDMTANTALTGLGFDDCPRLSSIAGIERAPKLRHFTFGNCAGKNATLESLMPLVGTKIESLSFNGKEIIDRDLSFLSALPTLQVFDFSLNLLPTEQVAWIAGNFPTLTGYALRANMDCTLLDKTGQQVPSTIIVGKRKPALIYQGNETRIAKYIAAFERLTEQYAGVPFDQAFPK